jgi:DNA-binding NarL/FixJ family response regulator
MELLPPLADAPTSCVDTDSRRAETEAVVLVVLVVIRDQSHEALAALTLPHSAPPIDRLSASEQRVLRYLPSNLTVPEIAREVYLSVNTVKTHLRHLYAKLGVHCRREAVSQAHALGLLRPSPTYALRAV